jgi:hypothetical protein
MKAQEDRMANVAKGKWRGNRFEIGARPLCPEMEYSHIAERLQSLERMVQEKSADHRVGI